MNEVMNIKQVSEYLGGNIGVKKIKSLMENGTLPSIEIGQTRMLCTRKKAVDNFIELMFTRPVNNGIVDTYPKHLIKKPDALKTIG